MTGIPLYDVGIEDLMDNDTHEMLLFSFKGMNLPVLCSM